MILGSCIFSSGAKAAVGGSSFGNGEFGHGGILMDDVNCSGNESVIQECKYLTHHDCTISELASAECNPNSGKLRCFISSYWWVDSKN